MKATFVYLDPEGSGLKEAVVEYENLLEIKIEDDESGNMLSVSKHRHSPSIRIESSSDRKGIIVAPIASNAINVTTPRHVTRTQDQ